MANDATVLYRPVTLWNVREPWSARPKAKVSSWRLTAEGHRPSSRQVDVERRATIQGGLRALYDAEVPGWVKPIVKQAVQADITKPESAKLLVVATASGPVGRVGGMVEAANAVRKAVQAAGLNKVAWAARGLKILDVADAALTKTKKTAGAVAVGSRVAGMAVTWIPIVGQVALAVTQAASVAAMGAATKAQIQLSQSLQSRKSFEDMLQQGMSEKGIPPVQQARTSMALEQERTNAEAAIQQAGQIDDLRARRYATLFQVLIWSTVVGVGVGAAYYIVLPAAKSRR